MCAFEKENAHRQQGTKILFTLWWSQSVQCSAILLAGPEGITVCDGWQGVQTQDSNVGVFFLAFSLLNSGISHSVTGLDGRYEVKPPERGLKGPSHSKRS